MLLGLLLFTSSASAFTDLDQFHHYEKATNYAAEQNYVSGYPDGTVKLDSPINRAEFLKIILTSANIELSGKTNCFPDVKEEWFANYICDAKHLGIIDGFPDGNFHPELSISFAEASKIVANTFAENLLLKADTGLYEGKSDTIWYKEYVWFLNKSNVIPVTIDDFSKPITRGEAFQTLFLLFEDQMEPYRRFNIVDYEFHSISPNEMYYAKDGLVYFEDFNGPKVLTDADPNTFELLPLQYAQDKDHIFNHGEIVDDATEYGFDLLFHQYNGAYDLTATKFENLWGGYAKSEKDEVLCLDNGETHLISEDASNFQRLNYYFMKDSTNLYYICDPVQIEIPVDMASLEYLDHTFFRDRDNIFKKHFEEGVMSLQVAEGFNVATFGASSGYAWDKDAVLYKERDFYEKVNVHQVIQADPATFEHLIGYIAKDKDNYYWFGKIFDKLDFATIQVVSWSCLKDNLKLYCSYLPEFEDANHIFEMTSIDVASFEKVPDTYYFKDKNHYYELVHDRAGMNDSRMEIVLDKIVL